MAATLKAKQKFIRERPQHATTESKISFVFLLLLGGRGGGVEQHHYWVRERVEKSWIFFVTVTPSPLFGERSNEQNGKKAK